MTEKRKITAKQKEARLKNLEAGRKKRMEQLQQKKEEGDEGYYNDSSSESSSDSDDLVISRLKAKKKTGKTSVIKRVMKADNKLEDQVNELRNMVTDLALLHKKQKSKTKKRSTPPVNINVLPNNPPAKTSGGNTAMDALRRSFQM
jgi:hypothetical protein